jgi:hypothetical protein
MLGVLMSFRCCAPVACCCRREINKWFICCRPRGGSDILLYIVLDTLCASHRDRSRADLFLSQADFALCCNWMRDLIGRHETRWNYMFVLLSLFLQEGFHLPLHPVGCGLPICMKFDMRVVPTRKWLACKYQSKISKFAYFQRIKLCPLWKKIQLI